MRRREFITLVSGAAAAWPVAVLGQQPAKIQRIAIVHPSASVDIMTETSKSLAFHDFFAELRRQGYIEGQNLTVERYSGSGSTDRYAELARTIAASKPDAIFCVSYRLAADFKAATATIPIVAITTDPVATGLAPSLAHQGGNLTGAIPDGGIEFYTKHLQLLQEAVPAASRIAYLTPRAVWDSATLLAPVKEAAHQVGVTLIPALLESPVQDPEYRRVFAAIAQDRADALIVGDSPENYSHRQLIIELAEHARLPSLYPDRSFVAGGGLMSYGVKYPDLYRHAGGDIAQILKGTNPGEIPFYQATRFELVVNLKTATALGLTLPPSLFARADEVIE